MSEDVLNDDQSHYEVSLTAWQAFLAFVLLLLSLAATFAFGVMVGRGQGDDRLVVKREPAVVNEASIVPKKAGKIVELGVADDDFVPPAGETTEPAAATETAPPVTITEEPAPAEGGLMPDATQVSVPNAAPASTPATPAAPAVPHYAQLLSSSDQKAAEALAAKLIDNGFNSAYVERGSNEKGAIYRVRVRFPSEAEARAAEPKLKLFSKEVWVTRQ